MNAALLAISVLASPAFEHVRDCAGLEPLRWQNALFRDAGEGVFTQEHFEPQTQWLAPPEDITGSRVVADCFAQPAPHSRDVVVHYYPPYSCHCQ